MSPFGLFGYFLTGLSAGTAAAIAVGGTLLLTGLYLLRLRRRRVLVPFAPLWTELQGEKSSERWAKRLRRLLSLLLQLLFLALLLTAAADPRPATAHREGRTVLILMDRSASMAATDEPGGRLARARQIAQELAGGLGSADRAMIASFAAGVSAETGFESDARILQAAAQRVSTSEEPGDLDRALEFAAAVLRGRPHPTLVLVSDGRFPEDARARPRWAPSEGGVSLAGIDVRHAPVGRRGDNVGILSFAARRYPADPTSVEAAVTLQNFRKIPSDVTLEITAGDQRIPVDRVHLRLLPQERKRHVLPEVAAPDALLEARLVTPSDDLVVDDQAFAVVPGLPRWKVLRVGPPNLFLDGALLSLGETVEVRRVRSADLETTRAEWPSYDAVIFDGVTPSPRPPPAGRYLYLDPHGPTSPFVERSKAMLAEPVISDAQRAHPLLRHISLADLNIAQARRLVAAPGDVAIASSFGAPLIVARVRPGLRALALAFDIRRSDLPMRSAFPLLLANALGWLGGGESVEALSLRTGRSVRLPVVPLAGSDGTPVSVSVVGPAGARRVPVLDDTIDLPLDRAGFYRVKPDRSVRSTTNPPVVVAANLADPIESNTVPAGALTLDGKSLPPPDPGERHGRRDLWLYALLAALALSLFEWWSYHRRWTV